MFFRKEPPEEPLTGLIVRLGEASTQARAREAANVRDAVRREARGDGPVGHRLLARALRVSAPTLPVGVWRSLAERESKRAGEALLYRLSESGTDELLERWRDGAVAEAHRGALGHFDGGRPASTLREPFAALLGGFGIHARGELLHEGREEPLGPSAAVCRVALELAPREDTSSLEEALAVEGLSAARLSEGLWVVSSPPRHPMAPVGVIRLSMLGAVREAHAIHVEEGASEASWTARNGQWARGATLEVAQDLDFLQLEASAIEERAAHVWSQWPLSKLALRLGLRSRWALTRARGAFAEFDSQSECETGEAPLFVRVSERTRDALELRVSAARSSCSKWIVEAVAEKTIEELRRGVAGGTTEREIPLRVALPTAIARRIQDVAAIREVTPEQAMASVLEDLLDG